MCRNAFAAVGVFSGALNILLLSGSMFMLQVYDRVLPSRSVPTLVGLVVIVAVLYAFQGLLDLIRTRILVRTAREVDDVLSTKVYQALIRTPFGREASARGLQPLRDLDQVRGFLASAGPTALFDLPWMPVYLALCFAFHLWIGIAGLIGAVILFAVTLSTEFLSRTPARDVAATGALRSALAEASRRNGEVLQAMGMARRMAERWSEINRRYMAAHQSAADVTGGFGAFSRVLRMALQSAVLAVGAYLVIRGEATAGIIIASSILTSRALAPVELAVAHWRGFMSARQSWRHIGELVRRLDNDGPPMPLPAPTSHLAVEGLSVAPPGLPRLVVDDVRFRLEKGQGLGIIGPTGSGKSSLVRALVGVWPPARGKIRLDGAALDQCAPDSLGRHVGYVPQSIELFEGSVSENIARFDPDPDPAAILAASQAAGVHELILRLPDGYNTQVGEAGIDLSAGVRQRLALARALYRDPFLVVLDEPNSNLDADGDQALTHAILGVRRRGGIVVVVAHRPSALMGVDMVLALNGGQVQAFGPKDEVLRKVLRPAPARLADLKLVPDVIGSVP
jgi:ATP-binding cassette subfamily C protein